MKKVDMYEVGDEVYIRAKVTDIIVENNELKYRIKSEHSNNDLDHLYTGSQLTMIFYPDRHEDDDDENLVGTGELYPGEFEENR